MIMGYRIEDDNETYYGIFSDLNVARAKMVLDPRGIRYEFRKHIEMDDSVLKEWGAYDESSKTTHVVYDLWILSDDINKLGSTLTDEFTEREYMRG